VVRVEGRGFSQLE
jgi:hypothetical protein